MVHKDLSRKFPLSCACLFLFVDLPLSVLDLPLTFVTLFSLSLSLLVRPPAHRTLVFCLVLAQVTGATNRRQLKRVLKKRDASYTELVQRLERVSVMSAAPLFVLDGPFRRPRWSCQYTYINCVLSAWQTRASVQLNRMQRMYDDTGIPYHTFTVYTPLFSPPSQSKRKRNVVKTLSERRRGSNRDVSVRTGCRHGISNAWPLIVECRLVCGICSSC